MTDDPWAELERLAREATAGPWVINERSGRNQPFIVGHAAGTGGTYRLVSVHQPYGKLTQMQANAAYIAAANPARIHQLIAENRRMKEAVTEAEASARRYARCYSEGSDGRNTFLMLADHIATIARQALAGDEGACAGVNK
ncbi:MAG: hypothetical protein ACK4FB_07880 [Brevundimonas sp.]|uniref:hypothetical protein n=1 Tax=Brevundimonas sp. TaxID=1871086 RepID=UPI003918D88E